MEIRLLCDDRDQLISERTRNDQPAALASGHGRARPRSPAAPPRLNGPRIRARLTRQLARLPHSQRLRVARMLLKRITEIGREERQLRTELSGIWSARRGTYRVLYRVIEEPREVLVLRVEHRRDAYRPA